MRLTGREREVLQLVALGCRDVEIAAQLDISYETVRSHVRNALAKLGARNRPAGVANALTSGELRFEAVAVSRPTGVSPTS